YLKYIGEDDTEEWKCNKYKCRRCNITFVWNRPNNPWDLLKFVERLKEQLILQAGISGGAGSQLSPLLVNLEAQMESLRNAISHVDKVYSEMIEKDQAMATLVKDFKKLLMIEKIKLEK